ncbi:hypothetical protein Goarm_020573, partial [Gossypium armourianum]|nr:hypothetical protein [Gossypium armourianum]
KSRVTTVFFQYVFIALFFADNKVYAFEKRVEMALVDNDLANLSLDEEEDEGLQFATEEGSQQPLYDLCLVGCVLTESVEDNIGRTFGEGAGKEDVRNNEKEIHSFDKQQGKGKEVIWQSDGEKEDMVGDIKEILLENGEGKKRFRLESHVLDRFLNRAEGGQGEQRGTCYKNQISATANRRLSLGWKSEVAISLRSYSKHHIDVNIKDSEVRANWRLTDFYGALEARGKSEAWDILRRLGREHDSHWLVCGDFNEILYAFEKEGGLPRDGGRMEELQTILNNCRLEDVGYSGRWFTWERGNLPATNIKEWLDRGVANKKWLEREGFRFEAWWTMETSYETEVKRLWDLYNGGVMKKLKLVGNGLQRWAMGIRKL